MDKAGILIVKTLGYEHGEHYKNRQKILKMIYTQSVIQMIIIIVK